MNRYLYIALALLGMAYGVLWYNRQPDAPPGIHMPATPAPELKGLPTIPLAVDFVKVFPPEAKKKLKLSAEVQANTHAHVIASSKTANDGRQHTVTTVIDDQTKEATTYDRVEPRPWLAVNTKSEIGVFYGLKGGAQAVRIEGRQELLQIKALHAGALASADMSRGEVDGFVGVGVWARW